MPTLRSERKKTYSPFLPISPISGKVLQVKIDEYRPQSKSIIFTDPTNDKKTEIEILEQIKLLKGDKTIIIISHDENCFKYCDKIFQISNN